MAQTEASSPTTMPATCAKTWTSGIMARAGEGRGKYALDRTSRPPRSFPPPSGAGCRHSADRRVGVVAFHFERGALLAQKLFHRGLCGDGLGDLVADAPCRLERGGDGLEAGAAHLQAEKVESDALEGGNGGRQPVG